MGVVRIQQPLKNKSAIILGSIYFHLAIAKLFSSVLKYGFQ